MFDPPSILMAMPRAWSGAASTGVPTSRTPRMSTLMFDPRIVMRAESDPGSTYVPGRSFVDSVITMPGVTGTALVCATATAFTTESTENTEMTVLTTDVGDQ